MRCVYLFEDQIVCCQALFPLLVCTVFGNMSRFGRTPLHLAARSGEVTDTMVLEHQATVNHKDDHGFTPLYHAAMFGDVRAIELLLQGGADIAACDLGGLTILHIACEKGRADAAVCLLGHGADLNALDSIGRTPQDWATDKGHDDVLQKVKAWVDANNL
jgi:ankyrin repeat protein